MDFLPYLISVITVRGSWEPTISIQSIHERIMCSGQRMWNVERENLIDFDHRS